jgi:hypothetical protein
MGEEGDPRIGSLFQIMNDLAKGQKLMMDLLGQLAVNTIEGPSKQNQNGEKGSNNGEGSHSCTTMQSHPHLYTKTPRPTMPQFLSGEVASEGPVDQDDSYLATWRSIGGWGMNFRQLCLSLTFGTLNRRTDLEGLK